MTRPDQLLAVPCPARRRRFSGWLVWFVWAGLLCSNVTPTAAQSPTPGQADEIEFFERRIRPLFARHCYECHSSKTGPENGQLILDSPAGIRRGGSRGPLFVAGKPEDSLLIQAVSYSNPDLEMPPESRLSKESVQRLKTWITRGASLPESTDVVEMTSRGPDIEKGRQFWAFRPIQSARVPQVQTPGWTRRPWDAFVLARMEQHGLQPSPQADRRQLIRRLSFDLLGLPPTPEQVQQFVQDSAPDAYEQLVDRLLASPHFGERWGRAWLDLARYTDTTASWLTGTGEAWLYRDWVVRALNENRPYDEFVRLQLAADQMPDVDPRDLAALGFLGLSPTYWKELRLAPEVIREVVAEEWDERIDAVSRTFLGLTVACARCHDHKFDPITVRDYYALAGVFASSQLDDHPLLPADQAREVRAARAAISKLESELEKLKDKKSTEAVALREQIEAIRTATPEVDTHWAHVLKDASIYVLPDGDEKTRLEYRDDEPRNLPVFQRGNPSNPGEIVPRRFLEVLSPTEPQPFTRGSGRGELAAAILGDAQGLAARVIVNRLWDQHFGSGLVRTPSNFGAQGERPTHPELLEYLSRQLIAHDWDLKWLHRELVLSATYRQSSANRDDAFGTDPENRFLWRMNRRRMDIEMWRDAMISASGSWIPILGGRSVNLDDQRDERRTLYATIARRDLHRVLRMYDFPEPTAHSPRRLPTTTPLQQLYVLNAPFVSRQADRLLVRLNSHADDEARIQAAYELLYARPPTDQELEAGRAFLALESEQSNRHTAWSAYLHTLLSLNEFLYVD